MPLPREWPWIIFLNLALRQLVGFLTPHKERGGSRISLCEPDGAGTMFRLIGLEWRGHALQSDDRLLVRPPVVRISFVIIVKLYSQMNQTLQTDPSLSLKSEETVQQTVNHIINQRQIIIIDNQPLWSVFRKTYIIFIFVFVLRPQNYLKFKLLIN